MARNLYAARVRPNDICQNAYGAEPWTVEMRREIEERMGIYAMEAYGLTEMGGPGTSFDCGEQNCAAQKHHPK